MMNFKSGAELVNAAKEINGEMKAGFSKQKLNKQPFSEVAEHY